MLRPFANIMQTSELGLVFTQLYKTSFNNKLKFQPYCCSFQEVGHKGLSSLKSIASLGKIEHDLEFM